MVSYFSLVVVISYLSVLRQTSTLSIVVGSGSRHGHAFRDSAPLVVIPLTSFVNPFNVGQDIKIEANVKSLGAIFNGIRSSLEHVAGNVIENLGNLRSQLVLEAQGNKGFSAGRIGRLLDEQIHQTRRTVTELRGVFLAGVREGARDDMTPRKAVQFVGESIAKSLNDFWNSSEETLPEKRAEERIDEGVIDDGHSSENDGKPETKTVLIDGKITQLNGTDFVAAIPEELRIRLEKLHRNLRHRNKTMRIRQRTKAFNFLSEENAKDGDDSQTTKKKLREKAIKLGNNTISELLSTLGQDCLAIMLCKAGADPYSMGTFGPWAIENFDDSSIKSSTKKLHAVLVEAYHDGKRYSERNKQRCTSRFDKCEFFHTYESS